MNEQEMRVWIENASYQELLYKWRFEPSGSPWFQGDVGVYYHNVLRQRKDSLTPAERVTASKQVGWGK